MRVQRIKKMTQAGFTLIELIVVIVILGVMAAVAIPKFSDTSASAYTSVQKATLGALKSAWAVAYSTKKSEPTITEVFAQMADPVCSGAAASFTCGTTAAGNVVYKTDGSTAATFTATTTGTGAVIASPSDITILSGS